MNSINVSLTLVADPVFTAAQGQGQDRVNFRGALRGTRIARGGQPGERTNDPVFQVVQFGASAQQVVDQVKAGDQVHVSGRIDVSELAKAVDRNGQVTQYDRPVVQIIAQPGIDGVTFGRRSAKNEAAAPAAAREPVAAGNVAPDDIPF